MMFQKSYTVLEEGQSELKRKIEGRTVRTIFLQTDDTDFGSVAVVDNTNPNTLTIGYKTSRGRGNYEVSRVQRKRIVKVVA